MRGAGPAALLAFSALLASCGGGEDCSLRWTEGAVTTWLHESEASGGTIAGAGGDLRVALTVRETILRAPPRESALRTLRVERIAAERRPAGAEAAERWDSADGKASPDAGASEAADDSFEGRTAMLRRVVGAEFDAWTDPTGQIETFDRLEGARERSVEGLPPGAPAHRFLTQFLQPAPLRILLGAPVRVPPTPTEKDTAWAYDEVRLLPPETTGIPAVLYCSGSGRLVSVDAGIARIEVAGTVALDPPAGAPPIPEAFRELRPLLHMRQGTFRGFARVETGPGRLLEAEHAMDLDLTFKRPGNPTEIEFSHRLVNRVKRQAAEAAPPR